MKNFPILFLLIVFVTTAHTVAAQKPTKIHPRADTTAPSDSQGVRSGTVFEKVDVPASVNKTLWRRHLENQLMTVIKQAAGEIEPGLYTVLVRFIVETDGSISEVQALNDPGGGLAAGAVQVIKTGPRWIPGEQNGRVVRSFYTQPISFVIAE